MDKVDLNLPEVKAAVEAEVAKQVEAQTKGLKGKNEELLDEVKELRKSIKKFENVDVEEYNQLKANKTKKEDENSDPTQLRQRIEAEFTPKIEKANRERDEAVSKLNDTIVENQLTTSLVEAGVAKEFLPAVKALLKSGRKVEVNDGGAVIDGEPVAAFAKKFVTTDEGKRFAAAADNSGGGAGGGGGGGAATGKKVSEMSNKEKAAFIAEHGPQAWSDKVANETKA